jgi:hypothetical protein
VGFTVQQELLPVDPSYASQTPHDLHLVTVLVSIIDHLSRNFNGYLNITQVITVGTRITKIKNTKIIKCIQLK